MYRIFKDGEFQRDGELECCVNYCFKEMDNRSSCIPSLRMGEPIGDRVARVHQAQYEIGYVGADGWEGVEYHLIPDNSYDKAFG